MTPFLLLAALLIALSLAFVLPTLVGAGQGPRQRKTALALALAVPLFGATLYAALGTPAGIEPAPPAPPPAPIAEPGAVTPAQIEAMVQRLAERLRTQPDDVNGWQMLARSYETLRRFGDAAQAYGQLERLQPQEVSVLTAHAVALAMSQGQRLRGEPEKLIARALALEPRNVQALALAGSAAYEREDYAAAADSWMKVLDLVPPESEIASSIAESIQKAQALALAKNNNNTRNPRP